MATFSIPAGATPPGFPARSDTAFSVGTEFYPTSGVWLIGMRWHRPDTTALATPVTGRVYSVDTADGTTGTPICPETTFTIGTGAGWKDVTLATPVRLAIGQRYRAVTRAERFTQVDPYWASTGAGTNGITQGPLTAPNRANALGQMQGSFGPNTALGYPNNAAGASGTCWFSDVLVTDVDPTGLSQAMFFNTPLQ